MTDGGQLIRLSMLRDYKYLFDQGIEHEIVHIVDLLYGPWSHSVHFYDTHCWSCKVNKVQEAGELLIFGMTIIRPHDRRPTRSRCSHRVPRYMLNASRLRVSNIYVSEVDR